MDKHELLVMNNLLLKNPGQSFISKDGLRLYILEAGKILCISGPEINWNNMTEDAINWFLEIRGKHEKDGKGRIG